MAKVRVIVEEHLAKEIEVEVDDNLDFDVRMDIAEDKVREMIKNEDLVLTADDFNGTRLMQVTDLSSECETEWFNV